MIAKTLLQLAIGLVTFPVASHAEVHSCAVLPGWSTVAARGASFVVFGEIHGTQESPAFVGDLACGLSEKGERLLVGLELQATDNPALQRAWSLADDEFSAALKDIGWTGRVDGVGSVAMFQLLQRLHHLRSRGRHVDVVAFNGFADANQQRRLGGLPGQGGHEAAQAENIRKAAESRRYDRVLILVGNLHARKTPMEIGAARLRPMAMQLGSAQEVTTLKMRASGGSMWNCLLRPNAAHQRGKRVPTAAIDCGVHDAGNAPVDLGPSSFIMLGAFPGEREDSSYDGYYWVGRMNGSPPVAPRRKCPLSTHCGH